MYALARNHMQRENFTTKIGNHNVPRNEPARQQGTGDRGAMQKRVKNKISSALIIYSKFHCDI